MSLLPETKSTPAGESPANTHPKWRCAMNRHGFVVSVALVALMFLLSGPGFCGERESLLGELRTLVDEESEAFLLTEIQRVQPFYKIRALARFQEMQDGVGGGFCGCLPGQLMKADEIPLPVDDIGVLQAAVFLARQRKANQEAIELLGFPVAFPSGPLPNVPLREVYPNMAVHVDVSVPSAFLEALDDGEITMGEAREIAQLPANRELLRFVCGQREGTEPWVTEQTLTYFIWKVGSADPLDRLWRWVNPMNDFGYADLAANAGQYRSSIEDLQARGQDVSDAVLARIASFLPPDAEIDESFAFVPGVLTEDWATPAMSGANVAYIKGGWEELVRRISAGVFRRQLLNQLPGRDGDNPHGMNDLISAGLDDERFQGFYELIAYAVLEGTVDYVSNPSASIDQTTTFIAGAELIDDFVVEVIKKSQVESAVTIFERGRGPGGSLSALGRHMARVVAERDGSEAVTVLLEQGIVTFFQRALEIESDNGSGTISARS